MFSWKSIPGWIFLVISFCWEFLGAWARIEFIIKKIWPESSIMPSFSTIVMSRWFSLVLLGIGLAWIWWSSRPVKQRKEFFIPLKEAVQQLYDKCVSRVLCKQFIDEHIKGANTPPQDVWDRLAELFLRYANVPIYGKDIYSNKLTELKLDEDEINNMYFDDNVSSLQTLIGNRLKYNDLSIKSDEVNKAIDEIIKTIEETRRRI